MRCSARAKDLSVRPPQLTRQRAHERTTEAVYDAIAPILGTVSPAECAYYFRQRRIWPNESHHALVGDKPELHPMQRPPRDIAPSDQTLTPYDREHAVTYSTHPTGAVLRDAR